MLRDPETGSCALVAGTEVEIRVRPGRGADAFRRLLGPVIGEVAARRGLLTAHGAGVRGGRGFLVLGGTGSGKSTTAASALAAGWSVLADDAVLLDPRDPAVVAMTGIPRLVTVPTDLAPGDRLPASSAASTAPGTTRARRELRDAVIERGSFAVDGVVLVTHGTTPRSEVRRAEPGRTLRAALAAFWAVDRAGRADLAVRTATRLARLPGFELRLGTDPARRIASTGEALALLDRGEVTSRPG